MEMTRFIAHFAQAVAADDTKVYLLVRHRSIKRETSLEFIVPQLATVILLNLIMHRLRARRDWYGMALQTVRVAKSRQHLDNRIDARVEALTELLWIENAKDPKVARANRDFLDWAVSTRTARTFNLQESA